MPDGNEENSPDTLDDSLAKRLEREFEALSVAEDVIGKLLQDMKESGLFNDKRLTVDDIIEFKEKWFELQEKELERRAAGISDIAQVEGCGGHHGRWTSSDDRVLLAMLQNGHTAKEISIRLGRTERAVKDHLKFLGF